MRRLILVGTDHHDLLGTKRLRMAFNKILSTTGSNPSFIAVEYPEQTHYWMLRSRDSIRESLLECAPDYDSFIIESLAETFSYEPEVVRQMFPDSKIVWLENEIESPMLSDLKIKKVRDCLVRLRKDASVPANADPKEAQRLLEEYCSASSSQRYNADPLMGIEDCSSHLSETDLNARDALWLEKLKREVDAYAEVDSYGVIVAGEVHLLDQKLPYGNDYPKTIYRLLKETQTTVSLERMWLFEQTP